jgi:hypothetical protein
VGQTFLSAGGQADRIVCPTIAMMKKDLRRAGPAGVPVRESLGKPEK